MVRVIKDHRWFQKYGADKREDEPWSVDKWIQIECKISLFYMQIRPNGKKCQMKKIKRTPYGNSLAVQWLGLQAFTADGMGLIAGQGTKIPQAVRCSGQKKKNFFLI